MKSINGITKRIYHYFDENKEFGIKRTNIKVFGVPTLPERNLNLVDSLSKAAESDTYWTRQDIDYPNEALMFKIMEDWSVNPFKLKERTDIKKELGRMSSIFAKIHLDK